MKTYRDYSHLPAHAAYIGGSYPDGSIDLSTLDALDDALAPVCLIESDGTRHYFDIAIYLD
jgi:hypothetical protein